MSQSPLSKLPTLGALALSLFCTACLDWDPNGKRFRCDPADLDCQRQECTEVCTAPAPRCVSNSRRATSVPATCATAHSCTFTDVEEDCAFGCEGGECKPDPCSGVTCDKAPAAACADASSLRTYGSLGTCAAGSCSYSATTIPCPFGCTAGACKADPCAQITCTTPPAQSCSGGVLRKYDAAGTCAAGSCSYSPRDSVCAAGCSGTECAPANCSGVTCSTPPAAACASVSTLRTYTSSGTCVQATGACEYAYVDSTCAFGCANGACMSDPCSGVTCNAPPPPACKDANTRVTYAPTGVCSGGQCGYTPTDTACAFGCAGGACNADPCATVVCANSPLPTCVGPNTMRGHKGVCSAGQCTYPTVDINCPGGCEGRECRLPPPASVTLMAGHTAPAGYQNGPAGEARFYEASALGVSASGTIAVGDRWHAIRSVSAGQVSLLAGNPDAGAVVDGPSTAARLGSPRDFAFTPAGELLFLDFAWPQVKLRKVALDGTVSTVAGSTGGNQDGIPGQFYSPTGLAVSDAGVAYIVDGYNDNVRKVVLATGAVSTLAGYTQGYADGTGINARFSNPFDVVLDAAGNLLVSDEYNDRIRKVTPTGVVTTVAGADAGGYLDGPASAALLNSPEALALSPAGDLYIADQLGTVIRKLSPSGTVSTFAGKKSVYRSLDGPPGDNSFSRIEGLAFDTANNRLLVTDGNAIRAVAPDGTVSTVAGMTPQEGVRDGQGLAARFGRSPQLSRLSATELLCTDPLQGVLRKVSTSGAVTTLLGVPYLLPPQFADGAGAAVRLANPEETVAASPSTWYLSDSSTLRVVTGGNTVTTLAGLKGESGGADGQGSLARLGYINALRMLPSGDVLVVEDTKLRKVTPSGLVTTLVGSSYDKVDGPAAVARFSSIGAVIEDPSGGYVLCDSGTLRKVAADYSVRTLSLPPSGGGDGTVLQSDVYCSYGMVRAPDGTLILGDSRALRRVDLINDTVRTIPLPAEIQQIRSMVLMPDGALYISVPFGLYKVVL